MIFFNFNCSSLKPVDPAAKEKIFNIEVPKGFTLLNVPNFKKLASSLPSLLAIPAKGIFTLELSKNDSNAITSPIAKMSLSEVLKLSFTLIVFPC